MITQLTFHDTKFDVIEHNNQIWISSRQLAEAIGYKCVKSIANLYNQNSEEFTDGMSQVIESVTSGNYRKKVRIFSLRGAHLIAMFARTPVAKEFRRWVLDILDREVESVPTKAIPVEPVLPFPEERRFILTVTASGKTDIRQIGSDMFVGKVSSILSGLRESGWIVIKRDRLVETIATW
ncbi:hypothetical protein FEQ43_06760 [Salmonella enterica]|nr:hypothetical protein [Salmonella enterica]EBG6425816.1 hypothetical protein [Salmonella enterica]